MARVFITGSTDGLGRAAARTLIKDGHKVVVHARNTERLAALRDLLDRGAKPIVGDLSDLEQTREVAGQVNRLGPMDAVIHNAGVISGPHLLPANVVAPYALTALIDRPRRLIYLSSSMHRGGRARLTWMDWSGRRTTGSYSDSKLFVTTLAIAVAHACAEQYGRPRMGADEDGQPRRAGRSAARAPDPGVARDERRSGGAHLRRLLVPPTPRGAGPRRP